MPRVFLAIVVLLCFDSAAIANTLKEMFDRAGAGQGYDKYISLETGVTYEGGLWIGRTFNRITEEFDGSNMDVRIVGNGAIIDLQGGTLCNAYSSGKLDISDCVILNGCVKFYGYDDGELSLLPAGSVKNVTFYKPHDYGVRLHRCGENILVQRNLFIDAVDTGEDFVYLTGFATEWLPTGSSVSASLLYVPYGIVDIYNNWSFHSDPVINGELLRHFNYL